NVNGGKANYLEGDSLPYRIRFDDLSLAAHAITIKWDTTKNGAHGLDYITTFNRTVTNANPCVDVTGCDANTFTTFAIPLDPQVAAAGKSQIAGDFRLYGGTITSVNAYSYPDGTDYSGTTT